LQTISDLVYAKWAVNKVMINRLKKFINPIIIGTVVIFSFLSPTAAFAATYGSGVYGNCDYNSGCTTSSNSNSNPVASAVNSAGNSISAFFCSNQAPSSAPNLYQIDVTDTSAKLYFAPAGTPYDRHYISYGQGDSSEGYGVETPTSNSNGAIIFTINQLSPSTIYTFKVRGGNGCKPGPWSGTLTIKTQRKGTKTLAKFYPNNQAQYVQAKPASWVQQAQAYVSDILPKGAPATGLAKAEPSAKSAKPQSKTQSPQPSLWQNITHFFTHLF
jgi:hypothetical protein